MHEYQSNDLDKVNSYHFMTLKKDEMKYIVAKLVPSKALSSFF